MFLAAQPSHMREEESSRCVMGICISIGEFMMNSMVTYPLKNAVLKSRRLEINEIKLKR
jgi:hypothetical protein